MARSVGSRTGRAVVAALKTTPPGVLEDLDRLAELGGLSEALARDTTTILRTEIAWHFPFPGANTTPWQLEGAIGALNANGFQDLVCAHGSGPATDTIRGQDLNNYLPVLKRYDAPVIFNLKDADVRWIEYRPKAELRVLHRMFPHGIHLPDYYFGKNVVHLPTMKCHLRTQISGAMTCAFKGLLKDRGHHSEDALHEALVDVLAIQKEIHAGSFAFMDGTTAGDGPGPRTMFPVVKNYVLASADQVAIDAVAARMMGFDPMSIRYLRLAHDAGLGVADPKDIKLEGHDISKERWGFSLGAPNTGRLRGLLRARPLARVRSLALQTPLARALEAGNELYHDFYRWPRFERETFEHWKLHTGWGQLFAAYERGESEQAFES